MRTNNSANYAYTLGPVIVRAQVASRDSAVQGDNIPYSASIVYEDPHLKLAASYIRPQADHAHWAYTAGQFNFGFARLYAGYGFGQNTFSQSIHNQMAGLSIPIGPAQAVMTTFSHTTSNGQTIQCRSALGYFLFPVQSDERLCGCCLRLPVRKIRLWNHRLAGDEHVD